MLDKLGGVFAPRPSTGPHKLRESLPLVIILRNRLKYALTGSEVTKIVMQRTIKVDGKVRTDKTYPAGFMGESFSPLTGHRGIFASIDHHGIHRSHLCDNRTVGHRRAESVQIYSGRSPLASMPCVSVLPSDLTSILC